MKKVGKFIRNNVIGFILGAIIFGGSALVVAGTVASSEITYTNNNQSNVQGALNDLYEKANSATKIMYDGYVYWNDNYSNKKYSSTSAPSTVYPSYSSLLVSGSNKAFIRTIYENGNIIGHDACQYIASSNKIFCIQGNYWKSIIGSTSSSYSNGEAVKTALKTAMEEALGTSISCYNGYSNAQPYVWCGINTNNLCFAFAFGYSKCGDGQNECHIYEDGKAKCGDGSY